MSKTSACGRTLYVKGRTTTRLSDSANNLFADFAQPLYKTDRCGGLPFSQGGWRNCGDIDVLSLRPPAETRHCPGEVHLANALPHLDQFVIL